MTEESSPAEMNLKESSEPEGPNEESVLQWSVKLVVLNQKPSFKEKDGFFLYYHTQIYTELQEQTHTFYQTHAKPLSFSPAVSSLLVLSNRTHCEDKLVLLFPRIRICTDFLLSLN